MGEARRRTGRAAYARPNCGAAQFDRGGALYEPTVVKAIWQAVKRLRCGAERSERAHLPKIYPAADILHTGFEKLPLPQNHFALAIGPPFGNDQLYFRSNPEANGHTIHNQFFLASLEAFRDSLMNLARSRRTRTAAPHRRPR